MSPMGAPKPCAYPGCPALVNRREWYCEKHRKQYERNRSAERRRARGVPKRKVTP